MPSNVKDIRKQIRNVIQEELSNILTTELVSAIHKRLQAENTVHLTAIQKSVQDALEAMNQRSKDVQSFLVRSVTENSTVTVPQATPQPSELQPKGE